MIQKMIIAFLILLSSCATLSDEDRILLVQDRENKKLEIMYLEEIHKAQENHDYESLEFFLQEYIEVERLDVPTHLREHPDYFIGGIKIKY